MSTRVVLTEDRISLVDGDDSITLDQILDVDVFHKEEKICLSKLDAEPFVQLSTDPNGSHQGRIYRFRATSSDFEIKLRELWQKCRNVRELSAKYSAVNAVVDVRRILKRYHELEVVRYFTVSMIVSVRFVISRALYNFCALTLWLNIRTLQ